MASAGPKKSVVDMSLDYLSEDRPEELVVLLKSPDRRDELAAAAWDMVPALCSFLTMELEMSRRCVVSGAALILEYLAEISNPKELLLVLLEQADTFKDDVKFSVLLNPIKTCLLRLPTKRSHSLAITLETVDAHLEQLPLPDEHDLEGKEKILLNSDAATARIVVVVNNYLEFLRPLVEEVSWRKAGAIHHREAHKKQIKCLSFSLMKCLGVPMAFTDLLPPQIETAVKSRSRLSAEQIISFLGDLHPNIVDALLEYVDEIRAIEKKRKLRSSLEEADELDQYNVEEAISDLALAVFVYLGIGERIIPDSLPQVFTHEYYLELSLPFISILLQQPETLIIHKGLSLLESLLHRIPVLSLPGEGMEDPDVVSIVNQLLNVMASAKVKELGQMSVNLLSLAMKRFSRKGRSRLVLHVLNTCKHSGIVGHMITLLKDEIKENLGLDFLDDSFCGRSLARLLKNVFVLPDGEKSDLLENKETILSSLALVRFCLLRDSVEQNKTGIWDLLNDLETSYFAPLRSAINLSRAHYELELKQLTSSPKERDISFTVGSDTMPGLSIKQQQHVLQMALSSFDVIESILGRVSEIIDQQRCNRQTDV